MAKEIILGIGGLEHNSAASLMVDGNIIAAAEEERFNRIKHYKGFPEQSVRFCLDEAGVSLSEVTEIAVGEVISESYAKRRDYIKIESSNRSFVYAQPSKPVSVYLPAGSDGNFVADDENLGKIARIEEFARQCKGTKNIRWIPHHIAHGASSFYTHNLQESAYLSVDYLGEFETIVCGKFTGNNYFNYYSIDYPHSLGFLYSAITRYLGFSSQSDEYKIMGLASYGKPIYINDMRRLVNLKGDGKLELDIDYFNIGGSVCSEKSVSDKFISLFGISRQPHDPYTQKHADIASSLQRLIKESVIHIARYLKGISGSDNLCYTGELALNCDANTAIVSSGLFKNVFIHPASHDAGTAIGACYYVDRIIKRNNRPGFIKPAMYLGSGYTNGQIKAVLDEESLKYQYLTDEELISNCAYDLSNNLVAGWFQGKMEWGPRALGNRSILANPAHRSTVDRINHTIKFREPFRPFAPSVLKEEAKNYFRFPEGADMSYMLYLADAYEVTIKKAPAIVHVDGTSRIQTVDFADNPLYWKLINKFKSITGIPILLNTSFNVKGEPIVRTPREAVRCFTSTGIDVLYIGNFRISKQ